MRTSALRSITMAPLERDEALFPQCVVRSKRPTIERLMAHCKQDFSTFLLAWYAIGRLQPVLIS